MEIVIEVTWCEPGYVKNVNADLVSLQVQFPQGTNKFSQGSQPDQPDFPELADSNFSPDLNDVICSVSIFFLNAFNAQR